MAGDRVGNRKVLCVMRATYLAVATALAALFLSGQAAPWSVFVLATDHGAGQASDITLRNLLVGETMPSDYLMRAMGFRARPPIRRGWWAPCGGPGGLAGIGPGLPRRLPLLCGEPGAHLQRRGEGACACWARSRPMLHCCAPCAKASPMSGRRPTCAR